MFKALWRWEFYRLARLRKILPLVLAALLIGLAPVYVSEGSGFWLGGLLGLLLGFFLVFQSASAREQEAHFFFSRPLPLLPLLLIRLLGALAMLAGMVGLVVPATFLADMLIYSSSLLVWVHLLAPAIFDLNHDFTFIALSILSSGLCGIGLGLLVFLGPLWRGLLRRPQTPSVKGMP